MIESLNKKWKELLFAASGFGPNFLMVLMGAYYTDAINPVALMGETYQAIMSNTCFILPALFPVLFAIGKIFDGIIDIPFAQITDSLCTKWGRRRPPIAICMIPMIVSYAMCWIPVFGPEGQLLNTIWVFAWSLVFFATYTMCLISFYGSISTTCSNESQRVRVAGYKSFFDTINYCIVYALVPLLLEVFKCHIDKFAIACLPIMLTIAIPLFMIKEGEKYGYPEGKGLKEKNINLFKSVKLTLTNKVYMKWLTVECCTVFGLQMFLVSMNAMMVGSMGFNGTQMAIANTCAFAPVPIMLYLFNKVKMKKGIRFTYKTCLASFSVCIMAFFFGSRFIMGNSRVQVQMVIAIIGGIMGSWSIGSFFMMPYLAASQISNVEEKIFGINHSAMYFAAEACFTSLVGAVSATVVYENIKMLFISKAAKGIVYAANSVAASEIFGCSVADVFNFGTLIVPFIVTVSCLIGVFFCKNLPRDFTQEEIAREFKRYDSSIDITDILSEKKEEEDKTEFIFVQNALSVLSAFIFGFIWFAYEIKSICELTSKKKSFITWLTACFVPFAGAFILAKKYEELKVEADKKNIKLKGNKYVYIISSVLLPIVPINLIGLSFLQSNINSLYKVD